MRMKIHCKLSYILAALASYPVGLKEQNSWTKKYELRQPQKWKNNSIGLCKAEFVNEKVN